MMKAQVIQRAGDMIMYKTRETREAENTHTVPTMFLFNSIKLHIYLRSLS